MIGKGLRIYSAYICTSVGTYVEYESKNNERYEHIDDGLASLTQSETGI